MTKLIAVFAAEAEVLGTIIEVDPQGATAWDVTTHIALADVENALDGKYDTDGLRDLADAPTWAREWSGPFSLHVQAMADDEAGEFLEKFGSDQVAPVAMPDLLALIPPSDGLYGRGFRDAIESLRLALVGEGVNAGAINRAVDTAIEAYGNNADQAVGPEEIESMLVVSTGHLTPKERAWIEAGGLAGFNPGPMLSMGREEGWLVYVNKPVDESDKDGSYEANLSTLSEGFQGVIRRALDLGMDFILFDSAGPYLDGVASYDDNSNLE